VIRCLARLVVHLFVFVAVVMCGWSAHGCLLGVSERLAHAMSERFGPVAITRLHDWQRMERHLPSLLKGDSLVLENINSLVNNIPYGTDSEIWGVEDYWATPAEFVSVNAGDCDDYVIAKYFTLRAHGVAVSKLRIVYVRALLRGRLGNHMVLAYYSTPDAEPLVLDNIKKKLLPVSQRPDLVPVYSFNDESVYREGAAGSRRINTVTMVRRWGELQERMQKEKQL